MNIHLIKYLSPCLRVSVVILFLCLAQSSSAAPVVSAPDTTIVSDPSTWDPSDPNCPCHALEKQAEDEYKRMQQAELNNQVTDHHNDNNFNNQVVVQNSGQDSVSTQAQTFASSTGEYSTKHLATVSQWKKLHREMKKLRRRIRNKQYGKKQHHFRVADCFHFH